MPLASSASSVKAKLTATSYAVLGIVALRGPSTTYEIKRALGHVATHFWTVPHTQCYTETQRLAASGLLSVDCEDRGRRRRSYALTEAGQRLLSDWFAEPATASMEIRDVAELKLLCAELVSSMALVALARQQVASYQERLNSLREAEERFANRPDFALRMAPARLGRRVYQVALDFWQDLAEHPPVRSEVAAGP
jgi:DNA-binding PadR family transcriptional regulator